MQFDTVSLHTSRTWRKNPFKTNINNPTFSKDVTSVLVHFQNVPQKIIQKKTRLSIDGTLSIAIGHGCRSRWAWPKKSSMSWCPSLRRRPDKNRWWRLAANKWRKSGILVGSGGRYQNWYLNLRSSTVAWWYLTLMTCSHNLHPRVFFAFWEL